jgi:hypothetical protein
MAPQLNTAQHILIKTLLKEGFETKLMATEASYSVRAVQRIRLRQQSEMPTTLIRTNRVGVVATLHHLYKKPSVIY